MEGSRKFSSFISVTVNGVRLQVHVYKRAQYTSCVSTSKKEALATEVARGSFPMDRNTKKILLKLLQHLCVGNSGHAVFQKDTHFQVIYGAFTPHNLAWQGQNVVRLNHLRPSTSANNVWKINFISLITAKKKNLKL